MAGSVPKRNEGVNSEFKMNKIVTIKAAIEIAQELEDKNKTIVLVGGCFDILHVGHIVFLEKAKREGDVLFVLLESDRNIKKLKGEKRPINTQKNRAIILSALAAIDYVVMLPKMKENKQYDKLIAQIKPSVIAITDPDPNIVHKKRQANYIGSEIVCVTKRIKNQSTTRLSRLISERNNL